MKWASAVYQLPDATYSQIKRQNAHVCLTGACKRKCTCGSAAEFLACRAKGSTAVCTCHTNVCLLCLAQDIDHDGDGTLLYEVRRLQGDCRW